MPQLEGTLFATVILRFSHVGCKHPLSLLLKTPRHMLLDESNSLDPLCVSPLPTIFNLYDSGLSHTPPFVAVSPLLRAIPFDTSGPLEVTYHVLRLRHEDATSARPLSLSLCSRIGPLDPNQVVFLHIPTAESHPAQGDLRSKFTSHLHHMRATISPRS